MPKHLPPLAHLTVEISGQDLDPDVIRYAVASSCDCAVTVYDDAGRELVLSPDSHGNFSTRARPAAALRRGLPVP